MNKNLGTSYISFTEDQYTKMLNCFGEGFTRLLPIKINNYVTKWELQDLSLIEYYSVNCLFTCISKKYGDCVLKIFGCEYKCYIDEINVLKAVYKNSHYVKVYECDESNGALLLERIKPGFVLSDEPSLNMRLSVFINAWENTHTVPDNPTFFKTYLKAAEQVSTASWKCLELSKLRQAALKMSTACKGLYEKYPKSLLLHGDLHGDNLLKNPTGGYTMIDPHGRIGPPICDLGRYIANEYGNSGIDAKSEVVEHVLKTLSISLNFPLIDVARAFFVDITLMTCWDAEDGPAEIEGVLFAENLLSQLAY